MPDTFRPTVGRAAAVPRKRTRIMGKKITANGGERLSETGVFALDPQGVLL